MKFVHMISQGCSIFKSFEAHVTVDCGILFMLMYSIEMDFQVVRIRENFLAKLTCSFIKQAYKENIKQRQRHKKDSIYYYWYLWNLLLCIFRACRLLHVLLHNSHTKVFPAFWWMSRKCTNIASRRENCFPQERQTFCSPGNNDKCSERVERVDRGVGLVPVIHWHVPPETVETGRGLVTKLTDKQLSLVLMDVSKVNF